MPDETERISGTLDAIAMYIKDRFDLNAKEADKVTTLLWLEQKCEFAETTRTPEQNIDLSSLTDFDNSELKAKGMIANSRVFINLSRSTAMALNSVPAEIVEDLLSQAELDNIAIKFLFRIANICKENVQIVPDGLACVCMRAWRYVKKQKHIPFQAEDIMPNSEWASIVLSRLTCDLTQDDGQQRLGTARWDCPYHKEGNYCNLTLEKISQILDLLAQRGVLVVQDSSDRKKYLFL